MLVTITAGASELGGASTYTSGAPGTAAAIVATGGQKTNELPYPFASQTIAASGTKQLPVHPRDLRERPNGGGPLSPAQELNQMLQDGRIASIAFADQSGVRDVEERALGSINDGL